MARTFKYVGPYDEVEIQHDGYVVGTVERNHTVTIEDPAASQGLMGSPDWEHIPDKKRSAVAKKAAASTEPAPAEPSTDTPAED